MRVQLIKFLVGIVFVLFCGTSVFAQDPEMVRHFDYDKSAPVDLKILGTQKRGDVTVYDVTYASPKGGVVPAYLVVPSGNGPFAACDLGSLVLAKLRDAQSQAVSGRSCGSGADWRRFASD